MHLAKPLGFSKHRPTRKGSCPLLPVNFTGCLVGPERIAGNLRLCVRLFQTRRGLIAEVRWIFEQRYGMTDVSAMLPAPCPPLELTPREFDETRQRENRACRRFSEP